MKRLVFVAIILVVGSLLALVTGCDKERIIESTEILHEIEYIELPPDTVYQIDTVTTNDSITIYITDTVTVHDTVIQIQQVFDTITVHDTVVTIQYQYDTTIVTDTILTVRCDPNKQFAVAALHYHSDPLVILFINAQFGYTDGWILYLSSLQLNLAERSPNVYDIAGYIDFWAPDWSGYYPLEFYWRMVFNGGDPADPLNWQIMEPSGSPAGFQPGLSLTPKATEFLLAPKR